jgi:hypothetical protein
MAMRSMVGFLFSAVLLVGCATARPQHVAGGTPRSDPRGVPVGGASLAFHPNTSSNFHGAESLGVPGSGAFAGSGRARIEAHREAMTGQKPPATIPEVSPPPTVIVVPVQAAPAAAPSEPAPSH